MATNGEATSGETQPPPHGVAVITGGGSGLGEATARELRRRGYHPALIDLPASPGPRVAEQLGGSFHPADVRSGAELTAAFDGAAAHGEIRALVTCAGVATPGRLLPRDAPADMEEISRVVEVNLLGTINAVRLAAERMAGNAPVQGDRGVVVMTASVAAYDGQIGQVAYAASKGGVAALTLPAARELARPGIRVMTIAPGTFATPMLAGVKTEVQEALAAQIPHPARLGDPAEYALLVAHILENRMLNGEVIRLDGALRMPPK